MCVYVCGVCVCGVCVVCVYVCGVCVYVCGVCVYVCVCVRARQYACARKNSLHSLIYFTAWLLLHDHFNWKGTFEI